MIKLHFQLCAWLTLLTFALLISCRKHKKSSREILQVNESHTYTALPPDLQVAEYIRHIFQDKKGNLWMGTNGYGVAHYNGDTVTYFSNAHGFGGQQITGISQDLNNNIWFATDQGVVKYHWPGFEDGSIRFTNYSGEQYFRGQRCWSILADSKGFIWAGGASGIFRFDGFIWAPFGLPYPDDTSGEFITPKTSWSITEDGAGNIWFSTNGYGAFKYDRSAEQSGEQSFTQYSEVDGLTDNSVDVIMEDSNGNIWFGTRHGGLSRFDGEIFINYTQENSIIGNNEVCAIYEDKAGNIWFSAEGYGVYRYDGKSFTNFGREQGLGVKAVQDIFEDDEGRIWVGGGGGLFRMQDEAFINVTRKGPWK